MGCKWLRRYVCRPVGPLVAGRDARVGRTRLPSSFVDILFRQPATSIRKHLRSRRGLGLLRGAQNFCCARSSQCNSVHILEPRWCYYCLRDRSRHHSRVECVHSQASVYIQEPRTCCSCHASIDEWQMARLMWMRPPMSRMGPYFRRFLPEFSRRKEHESQLRECNC